MTKTVVDFEEVIKLRRRLSEIDQIPFEKIEWRTRGQSMALLKPIVDNYRFTGLGNSFFPDTYYNLCYADCIETL